MATKSNAQFMGMEFPEFMDLTKIAGQFKVPNVDAQALMEIQRKNIEAMTAANRIALEGAQSLTRRQAEILRQAWDESTAAVQELTSAGKPEDKLAKQTEMAKHGFEVSVANARELAEISAKSNNEALELISKRIAELMDEVKVELEKFAKV